MQGDSSPNGKQSHDNVYFQIRELVSGQNVRDRLQRRVVGLGDVNKEYDPLKYDYRAT